MLLRIAIVVFFLIPFPMLAQSNWGNAPKYPEPELPNQGDQSSGTDSFGTSKQQYSHAGLHKDKSSVAPAGTITTFGYGSMMRMNASMSQDYATQISTGYIALKGTAHSNLAGQSVFASVIPMFVGFRYDFGKLETRSLQWTQYAVTGGGPLMGIAYPETFSLWKTFNRMSFRWGAGAYAGMGSEMRFSQGIGLYAQLEYTGYAFTAPLLDRSTYLGPSFSFGITIIP